MDRVTFDFETGEIIFDTDGQKGVEIDLDLKNKRGAIMAAAGYEQISMSEFIGEINQLFAEHGINVRCAEPSDNIPNSNPKTNLLGEDEQASSAAEVIEDVFLTLMGADDSLLPSEKEEN